MRTNRRTKILATLGPSSDSPRIIQRLVNEGADGFRLNLAHGTHEDHRKIVEFLRKRIKKSIAIVADIEGPKVRVGTLPAVGVVVKTGSQIIIDTKKTHYEDGIIPIPIKKTKIEKGSTIFLDDGTIVFEVEKVSGSRIFCTVVLGGRLLSKKGVNIPGTTLHTGMSQKDRKDILFCKKIGVDYISLSFLTSAKDVKAARRLIKSSNLRIIAKIESKHALQNFDQILREVDAVMIARGDLGLETPLVEVPVQQKTIIEKCQREGKPVIVATQMLASMMNSTMPTRAEVSDVANAVFEAADVVMLSGETASGRYPVESVRMMRAIIESSEKHSLRNLFPKKTKRLPVNIAVAEAACEAAHDVDAKFILVGTTSGASALAVAKYRPSAWILALTENQHVAQQLSIVWGVRTMHIHTNNVEASLNFAVKLLKKEKYLKKNDAIVYVSGIKFGKSGGTNNMRIIVV